MDAVRQFGFGKGGVGSCAPGKDERMRKVFPEKRVDGACHLLKAAVEIGEYRQVYGCLRQIEMAKPVRLDLQIRKSGKEMVDDRPLSRSCAPIQIGGLSCQNGEKRQTKNVFPFNEAAIQLFQ